MKRILLIAAMLVLARPGFGQHDSLSLSGPFSYGGLVVWLIDGGESVHQPYLTLEQALQRGRATIHENNSQTLWIENRSDTDLFVQSTDIIKGGQQDRMVENDMIIPAHGTSRDFVVYCVEKGRSIKRGDEPIETFSGSRWMAPSAHMRVITQHELTAQLLTPRLGGVTAPDPSQLELLESIPAMPLAFGVPDVYQASVWNDVDNVQHSLTSVLRDSVTKNASPTSLELALEARALSNRTRDFEKKWLDIGGEDKHTIGFVYAIGGRIVGSDVYGSHALFEAMWPKLLRSVSTQAIVATASNSPPPDIAAVSEFISRANHSKSARKQVNERTLLEANDLGTAFRFCTSDSKYENQILHEARIVKE